MIPTSWCCIFIVGFAAFAKGDGKYNKVEDVLFTISYRKLIAVGQKDCRGYKDSQGTMMEKINWAFRYGCI